MNVKSLQDNDTAGLAAILKLTSSKSIEAKKPIKSRFSIDNLVKNVDESSIISLGIQISILHS